MTILSHIIIHIAKQIVIGPWDFPKDLWNGPVCPAVCSFVYEAIARNIVSGF